MNSFCRFISIIIIPFFFASCGSNSSSDSTHNSTKSDELSYEFKEMQLGGTEKCSTGKQTFTDLKGYCAGLTHRKENNECALSTRKEAFKKTCTGNFEETNFPMFLSSFSIDEVTKQ